jgi:hypothetical protein
VPVRGPLEMPAHVPRGRRAPQAALRVDDDVDLRPSRSLRGLGQILLIALLVAIGGATAAAWIARRTPIGYAIATPERQAESPAPVTPSASPAALPAAATGSSAAASDVPVVLVSSLPVAAPTASGAGDRVSGRHTVPVRSRPAAHRPAPRPSKVAAPSNDAPSPAPAKAPRPKAAPAKAAPAPGSLDDLIRKSVEADAKKKQ